MTIDDIRALLRAWAHDLVAGARSMPAPLAAARDAERDPVYRSKPPANAAAAAGWYWDLHDLTRYAGNVEACTLIINGGRNGIADRQRLYDLALAAAKFPLAHVADGMAFGAEQ